MDREMENIEQRMVAMVKASVQHEDVTKRLISLLDDIDEYQARKGVVPRLHGMGVILEEWLQIEQEANAVRSVPQTP